MVDSKRLPEDQIPTDARRCVCCIAESHAKRNHRTGGPLAVASVTALCTLDYIERYGLEFTNSYICERHRDTQRIRDNLLIGFKKGAN
jgi:hypothetical protein